MTRDFGRKGKKSRVILVNRVKIITFVRFLQIK